MNKSMCRQFRSCLFFIFNCNTYTFLRDSKTGIRVLKENFFLIYNFYILKTIHMTTSLFLCGSSVRGKFWMRCVHICTYIPMCVQSSGFRFKMRHFWYKYVGRVSVLGSMLWSHFSAIFVNFRRKSRHFLKTNVMIQILFKLTVFWTKNSNF
jgi:hypothetical protein